MTIRDESYTLKFPEDADGVIEDGNGPALNMRHLSNKVFQIVAGTGGTFNLALQYSIDDGTTWVEFLAAQAPTMATAPTALPAVAEANVEVRCVVSGFSAEGSPRPVITLVGRRDT